AVHSGGVPVARTPAATQTQRATFIATRGEHTMKTRSILLSGVLLAATLPAFAQSTSGMQNMKSGQTMSGMKMHQNMPCMKMGKRMPMNGMPMGASAQGMRMGKN